MFLAVGQTVPAQPAEDSLKSKEEAGIGAKFEAEVCRDKKEQLLQEKGQRNKEKATLEAREKAEFARKEELRRAREIKISEKKAAIEANRQAVLEKKEKLREAQESRRREKEARIRAEKAAVRLNKGVSVPSLGTRYMCELGISSYRSGRLQEALSEFNKALIIEPENQTAQKYARNILKRLERQQRLSGK